MDSGKKEKVKSYFTPSRDFTQSREALPAAGYARTQKNQYLLRLGEFPACRQAGWRLGVQF